MASVGDKVTGKTKELKGKVTGDKSEELKGKARQSKGSVKGAVEELGARLSHPSRVEEAADRESRP